jgi:hypothetical protein
LGCLSTHDDNSPIDDHNGSFDDNTEHGHQHKPDCFDHAFKPPDHHCSGSPVSSEHAVKCRPFIGDCGDPVSKVDGCGNPIDGPTELFDSLRWISYKFKPYIFLYYPNSVRQLHWHTASRGDTAATVERDCGRNHPRGLGFR